MIRQLLTLFLAATALAEAPFSFEKTPGKLPKTVVPQSYRVTVEPDIAGEKFSGTVKIEIEARQAVRELVLNSLDLEITRAALGAEELKPKLDADKQLLTLPLAKELPVGKHTLELSFHGKLSERPQGMFLSKYQVGTEVRRALATQMEATDCRRMFPCWDEPVFRAKFQLTAIVPAALTAAFNMPLEMQTDLGGGKKELIFGATPSMPSYLFAFVCGEFEELGDRVGNIELRILATPGKREQGRYALEATKQILPFYEQYFGVPYPLPKLDQVALPSTGASGMENWGLILYSDVALLFDPATSGQDTKEWVYAVVAHELAHQWFGNLVTMAWWDNLWLNEGFASWMGTKATAHFNPDWNIPTRSIGETESALRRDARSTTHPIQQPIADEADAASAFDEITYSKGQAFLQMLETWLTPDGFRDGLRGYMKKHAFSNTTTADLWTALAEATKQPVQKVAANWTEQPGFPVLNAEPTAQGIVVRQERFTIHQKNPAPLEWNVPVVATRGTETKRELLPPGGNIALAAEPDNAQPWCLRPGCCRVSYAPAIRKKLIATLHLLDEPTRLCLINDSWALVQAGRLPLAQLLADLPRFADTAGESLPVWDALVDVLTSADALANGQIWQHEYRARAAALIAPPLEKLGWAARAGEPATHQLLRSTLVGGLARLADETTLRECRARYENFLQKPDALTGDLRSVVIRAVGTHADAATWEEITRRLRAEPSFEQKRIYNAALGSVLDPALAARSLTLALGDELIPRDSTRLFLRLGEAGHGQIAWDAALKNRDALLKKLGALDANEWFPRLATTIRGSTAADQLAAFAKEHLPTEAAREVRNATDDIHYRTDLETRLRPVLEKWATEQEVPRREIRSAK